MSRWFVILALLLAALTAFTQPGVCPCWLMVDVAQYHPHPDGHPEKPHSHDYLINLFNSQVIIVATLSFLTVKDLIKILESQKDYRLTWGDAVTARSWILLVEPPPPRIINP